MQILVQTVYVNSIHLQHLNIVPWRKKPINNRSPEPGSADFFIALFTSETLSLYYKNKLRELKESGSGP